MIKKFTDPNGGFFDTPLDGEPLLIRPKDISDNATPSGNALACEALLKIAAYTGEGKYRDLAEQALAIMGDSALRYPLGFARWLSAAENSAGSTKQIVVIGQAGEEIFDQMLRLIWSELRPGVVVAASNFPPPNEAPSLLNGRIPADGKATAYICEDFVCKLPATDPEELVTQLRT
ncbi:MAG: thioredoxin domain-containing protein [Anaerolineales bacterium]|nr:thioredoxin domain-containing protein [Anaerolineales bacterium]